MASVRAVRTTGNIHGFFNSLSSYLSGSYSTLIHFAFIFFHFGSFFIHLLSTIFISF